MPLSKRTSLIYLLIKFLHCAVKCIVEICFVFSAAFVMSLTIHRVPVLFGFVIYYIIILKCIYIMRYTLRTQCMDSRRCHSRCCRRRRRWSGISILIVCNDGNMRVDWHGIDTFRISGWQAHEFCIAFLEKMSKPADWMLYSTPNDVHIDIIHHGNNSKDFVWFNRILWDFV